MSPKVLFRIEYDRIEIYKQQNASIKLDVGLDQRARAIIMSAINWTDSSDNWTTRADWSSGATPQPGDQVTVAQGRPTITSDVGV